MIFITFERHDKTRSKTGKIWFQLVHWMAKKTVKQMKKTEIVVQSRSVKKEFLKIHTKHLRCSIL